MTAVTEMTRITTPHMAKDFQDKFVAFHITRSDVLNSDFYDLPSSPKTLFGFYSKSQSNYAYKIDPLLKSTAKNREVIVEHCSLINALFCMRIATRQECIEAQSALQGDKAKVAFWGPPRSSGVISQLAHQISSLSDEIAANASTLPQEEKKE